MKYGKKKKKKTRFLSSSDADAVVDLPSWPSQTSLKIPESEIAKKHIAPEQHAKAPKSDGSRDFHTASGRSKEDIAPESPSRSSSNKSPASEDQKGSKNTEPRDVPESAGAVIDESKQQMTPGQRSSYKSRQRQELIDRHLTLSRLRDQLIIQMKNVSNVILELAEAYHELKSSLCVPGYFCELDLLIEESLAAYERRQNIANQTAKEWSGLISKDAYAKKRRRPTIIAEHSKRRLTELYAIPVRQLRHEVVDLELDIEVYRKRIALDERKITLMGQRWAMDKTRYCCIRYFFLKNIIETAITDYRFDHG